VKRSPTPTLEDNEQCEDRHRNYEAKCNERQRHRGKDLIWRTHMQREEYNPNQHTWQLEIHEAHLCIRECRYDRREAEIRAARMRGTDTGNESGSE
jgi:hypothetical protein